MKPFSLFFIAFIALCLSGCGSAGSSSAKNTAGRLTEDQKHRLYSAALAASESPLDNDTFKDVCRKIGIFAADGQPNNQYIVFVGQHVDWAMRTETEGFRREIDSKTKAQTYIEKHLTASK